MSQFRFRLQRLLEIRQRTEREAATRLVDATNEADAARRARSELASVRAAGREQFLVSAPSPVGMLHNLSYVLARLDERLESAATTVAAAEHSVAKVEGELREAFRARHILDRLRDRQHDEWKISAANADRATMDAVALSRFTQRPDAADQG